MSSSQPSLTTHLSAKPFFPAEANMPHNKSSNKSQEQMEFSSGCPLRLTSLSVYPPRLLLFQRRIRKNVRAAQDETGPQKEDTETVGGSGSSKTQQRRRRGLERLNSLLTDGGRQSD
ncbi:hypothetical protein BKA81DRAFT_100975 [Phyllosticta paracitricarpa]